MSLGNGIWKMESVDFAAMPFQADSKRVPGNGVRGVFQSNWRLTLCALSRIEAHRSNVCSVTCKLDFGTPFYFIRGVSAPPDDVTSLGAADPGSRGGIAFTTTHWSVVLAAQGESPEAQEALEKLCRTYWWPLYGFMRRNGYTPEEAQDLTQGFFALLLERRDLDVVRREKGRLRSYLLVSLKNFLAKAKRRELTLKRGEGRALVPLDELIAREHADLEPADNLTADKIYERRWALTLLEQVLT